jgi:hypothetical protein
VACSFALFFFSVLNCLLQCNIVIHALGAHVRFWSPHKVTLPHTFDNPQWAAGSSCPIGLIFTCVVLTPYWASRPSTDPSVGMQQRLHSASSSYFNAVAVLPGCPQPSPASLQDQHQSQRRHPSKRGKAVLMPAMLEFSLLWSISWPLVGGAALAGPH